MTKAFIFLGPPGCGKGTQTELLARELKLPHIDTGSLLRKNIKEGTDIGLVAKGFIDKGQLVPINVVSTVIKNRLMEADCANGYILDGFPRSLEQAGELDKILDELNGNIKKEDIMAVYFDIPNEVLVERLVNRRSCPKCGKIYNIKTSAPKKEGFCDDCDVELIQNQLNQQPNHSDTLKQLEKAFAADKTDSLRHIYRAVNAVSTDVKTKEPTAQDDISANNPAPQVSIEKPEPARRPSQRLDIWLERQNAANSEARIVPQSAKTMQ